MKKKEKIKKLKRELKDQKVVSEHSVYLWAELTKELQETLVHYREVNTYASSLEEQNEHLAVLLQKLDAEVQNSRYIDSEQTRKIQRLQELVSQLAARNGEMIRDLEQGLPYKQILNKYDGTKHISK